MVYLQMLQLSCSYCSLKPLLNSALQCGTFVCLSLKMMPILKRGEMFDNMGAVTRKVLVLDKFVNWLSRIVRVSLEWLLSDCPSVLRAVTLGLSECL